MFKAALKIGLSTVLCVSVTSCSSWPQAGQGGMAENRLAHLLTVENHRKLTAEHGLRFDFNLLKNHLDLLILQGARVCFPASVKLAEQQQVRIARELSGQLFGEATSDIIIQRQKLARLELQLNTVLAQAECIIPSTSHSYTSPSPTPTPNNTEIEKGATNSNAHEDIEELLIALNSDNLFDTASDVINPKYANNLLKGTKQLKTLLNSNLDNGAYWQLNIAGYTDHRGSETYNKNLSQKRADAVAHFLIKSGIDPSHIYIYVHDKQRDLYPGSDAGSLLANRSVIVSLTVETRP